MNTQIHTALGAFLSAAFFFFYQECSEELANAQCAWHLNVIFLMTHIVTHYWHIINILRWHLPCIYTISFRFTNHYSLFNFQLGWPSHYTMVKSDCNMGGWHYFLMPKQIFEIGTRWYRHNWNRVHVLKRSNHMSGLLDNAFLPVWLVLFLSSRFFTIYSDRYFIPG